MFLLLLISAVYKATYLVATIKLLHTLSRCKISVRDSKVALLAAASEYHVPQSVKFFLLNLFS